MVRGVHRSETQTQQHRRAIQYKDNTTEPVGLRATVSVTGLTGAGIRASHQRHEEAISCLGMETRAAEQDVIFVPAALEAVLRYAAALQLARGKRDFTAESAVNPPLLLPAGASTRRGPGGSPGWDNARGGSRAMRGDHDGRSHRGTEGGRSAGSGGNQRGSSTVALNGRHHGRLPDSSRESADSSEHRPRKHKQAVPSSHDFLAFHVLPGFSCASPRPITLKFMPRTMIWIRIHDTFTLLLGTSVYYSDYGENCRRLAPKQPGFSSLRRRNGS